MAQKPEQDQEPWSPRIEGLPLFTNSADYERSLSQDISPPELQTSEEVAEDSGGEAPSTPADPQTGPETVSELAGETSEG
jgi:hypothetical protein